MEEKNIAFLGFYKAKKQTNKKKVKFGLRVAPEASYKNQKGLSSVAGNLSHAQLLTDRCFHQFFLPKIQIYIKLWEKFWWKLDCCGRRQRKLVGTQISQSKTEAPSTMWSNKRQHQVEETGRKSLYTLLMLKCLFWKPLELLLLLNL